MTLLADMSTSIMQHLPEGGGRLVDRMRAGVLLFAESMEEVGDAYSIAGFCSKYRDNVSYYTIKDFDEPLSDGHPQRRSAACRAGSPRAWARRSAMPPRASTASQSRRRLLLILSDGRPEDYDDGGDRRYLHEDTRMAVKEAVAKRRAPVLHHRRHHGQPVPAADFRARATTWCSTTSTACPTSCRRFTCACGAERAGAATQGLGSPAGIFGIGPSRRFM